METNAPDGKATTRDVWIRGLFMLLFMIGFAVGQWLLNLLALVQFVWLLFAREPNHFIATSAILCRSGSRNRTLSHWRHGRQTVSVAAASRGKHAAASSNVIYELTSQ